MGFFSNLLGMPSAPRTPEQPGGGAQADDNKFTDDQGRKIMPEIDFVDLDPKLSADNSDLELWGTVHNTSPFAVEIVRVELLGQSGNPGRHLKPGEKFEIKLYRGDTPKNDAYSRAKLSYKVSDNGDYFEQAFFVQFTLEDGYYVPKSIESDYGVRDI